MDETVSVSKGVFVFKNASNNTDSHIKKPKKDFKKGVPMLKKDATDHLFYKTFLKTWTAIQQDIIELQKESYIKTLEDIVDYIDNAYNKENFDCILPVAALLTGINQPDHLEQFENIKLAIFNRLDAYVTIIQSRDCNSLKSAIEIMVRSFIESSNEEEALDTSLKKIRKNQCTMQTLENWYINKCSNKERLLVIILPDFECFNTEILQDFILILNSYCDRISIILIFGVATATSAIHNTLSYRVTSKIKLKLFQTTSAVSTFNKIFDEILLSPKYNFILSGKILKFLGDIFLFYDFSINGFVQEFKYCLLEHFLQGDAFSLCTNFEDSLENLKYLTHDDFEIMRQLPSFRTLVENLKNPLKILSMFTTTEYWKKKLIKLLRKCQLYFKIFRCFIVFLTSLVGDLPKSLLGKCKRELYSICLSKDLIETESFCECWKMLEFLSKEEFIFKINKAVNDTKLFTERNLADNDIDLECKKIIFQKFEAVESLLKNVKEAGTDNEFYKNTNTIRQTHLELGQINRQQLKEKLLQMSKTEVPISDFIRSVKRTLEYIKTEIVFQHLAPPSKRGPTFYELFMFSDMILARKHIIGTPRATLHAALNDPYFYLQCNCCELDSQQSLKETLPDISVVYKLHLECGKLINLYDWLQAFRSIVDYQEDENEQQIDPKIQARFTRAVAELQFLGYIKTSKRKTDHVTRLTW